MGLFVSVKSSPRQGSVAKYVPLLGKAERKISEPVCGEQSAKKVREVIAGKISRI